VYLMVMYVGDKDEQLGDGGWLHLLLNNYCYS
jgi:hypothetical protein